VYYDYYRDTDWYEFTLADQTIVTLTANAEYPVLVGIRAPNDCALDDWTVFATGDACVDVEAVDTLAAGTYWAFISPQYFNGNPLPSTYRLTFTCAGDCQPDTVTNLTVFRDAALSNDIHLRWSGDAALQGTYKVYWNNTMDVFPGTWNELASGLAPAASMEYVDVGAASIAKRFYLVVSECGGVVPASAPLPKRETQIAK
jgi:hypothetical protein